MRGLSVDASAPLLLRPCPSLHLRPCHAPDTPSGAQPVLLRNPLSWPLPAAQLTCHDEVNKWPQCQVSGQPLGTAFQLALLSLS